MATRIGFYVKTNQINDLIDKIQSFTNTKLDFTSKYPLDFHKNFQYKSLPNYFLISQTQEDWVTVLFNSFDKLQNWCEVLSKEFATDIIVLFIQTTSGYYYFALYQKGVLRREIECCEGDFSINFGDIFPFEEEYAFYPDYADAIKYCEYFSLFSPDNLHRDWFVLKADEIQES